MFSVMKNARPGMWKRYTRSIYLFFSSSSRHTIFDCDWSSDVCSSDLIHSAGEKCPGKTGSIFIKISVNETRIPRPVTILIPARFSAIQNEAHAANQPKADAIEPTSEIGRASCRERGKIRVAAGALKKK